MNGFSAIIDQIIKAAFGIDDRSSDEKLCEEISKQVADIDRKRIRVASTWHPKHRNTNAHLPIVK